MSLTSSSAPSQPSPTAFSFGPCAPAARKDQPKLPPPAQSLLARDLVRLDTSSRLPRLFFTAAGLSALRRMFADKRLADPEKFTHVLRELGIDQRGLADAAG